MGQVKKARFAKLCFGLESVQQNHGMVLHTIRSQGNAAQDGVM